MNNLVLKHIPNSRSVRTLWLLNEIGCAFSLRVSEEGMSALDALRSPVIPSLSDGDVTIHETGAMTEWLCETRATHLWRAPGMTGRLGWLDWLHFGETLLRQVPKGPCGDLTAPLQTLEGWLKRSEWLLDEFSGVDCQVGYSVWVASQAVDLGGHPALTAYLARCIERPAFQVAVE